MAYFSLQKNRQGLLVLIVLVGIIAVFMLGRQYEKRESEAVITGAETEVERGERDSQTKPNVPAVVTPSRANLNGSTFRLSSYNGHIMTGGTSYTVSFKAGTPTFEDGFVEAKFCNTLASPYHINGNVFKADLSGTKMYCSDPKDIMDIEGAFNLLVSGGAQMTLQGNALTLSDNVRTMVFIRH